MRCPTRRTPIPVSSASGSPIVPPMSGVSIATCPPGRLRGGGTGRRHFRRCHRRGAVVRSPSPPVTAALAPGPRRRPMTRGSVPAAAGDTSEHRAAARRTPAARRAGACPRRKPRWGSREVRASARTRLSAVPTTTFPSASEGPCEAGVRRTGGASRAYALFRHGPRFRVRSVSGGPGVPGDGFRLGVHHGAAKPFFTVSWCTPSCRPLSRACVVFRLSGACGTVVPGLCGTAARDERRGCAGPVRARLRRGGGVVVQGLSPPVLRPSVVIVAGFSGTA